MREYKFRFYDKINNEMSDPKELKHLPARYKKKQYTPMQYTGIKDKNGKEICEGDIIIIKNDKSQIQEIELICVVSMSLFGAYCATVEKVNKWDGYRVDPPTHKKALYLYNLVGSKRLEIIGNIHEKPGLLSTAI